MVATDTDRARDALRHIPPDLPRDDWVKAGMAAHAAGLDFDTFNDWSAQAGNYNAADARDVWRSIKPGKGIGAGTLFKMAATHGWRMSDRTGRQVSTRQHRSEPRPHKPAPGMSPAEVWARCEPATHMHPYIMAKNGSPEGLRVVPAGDALRITGESMAGWLVVPVVPLDGREPLSLQFVPPPEIAAAMKACGKKGTKPNLPRAPMDGVFIVGELVPGGTAYLCEGIGQAWACWQATGHAAVVCFGWGRVRGVAKALRHHDPAARLVVVPDVGKEPDAAKIPEALDTLVVNMPEGWPHNSDVNDLAQREGIEALAELLEAAKPPEPPPLPLGVVFADELPSDYNPPDELVQGVLTAGAGSMLYGDSNSGKTFLCIDMACAVARGVPWMGRKTEQGLVVYVAAESPASVRSRLQAYQQHHGCRVPHFAIVQAPLDLFAGDGDTEALIALVRQVEKRRGQKVRLIVGDTLARLSAGANENSGEDMGLVVRRFDRIRNECAAHFLLVHHSGKAAAAGARGWSGIRAAMDTEIEVTDTLTGRCAEVTKQRDLSTKGERIGFTLECVTIGLTKWHDPATTCVVVPTDAPVKQPKGKRMGPVEGAVLEFLRAKGVGVTKGEVVKHFAEQYHRPSIYRAITALGDSGMANIAQESGRVCIADAAK